MAQISTGCKRLGIRDTGKEIERAEQAGTERMRERESDKERRCVGYEESNRVEGGGMSQIPTGCTPRPDIHLAYFIGKEFQFKTFWQCSLLHNMIFMSDSKAFVQKTSSPESFKSKFFSYKI